MIQFLSRFKKARVDRPRRAGARTTRPAVLVEGLESRNLLSRAPGILGLWSGIFTNAVGVAAPISGLGTNSVQFGTPAPPNTLQNSLNFGGARIPTTVRVAHHTSLGLVAGTLTFQNTALTNPPLSQITLKLGVQSNLGSTTVNVPLNLKETPDLTGPTPDIITLVGRPTIRTNRGITLQIVGFGIPSKRGGLIALSNHFSAAEASTTTVPLLVKVIHG